MEKDKRQDSGSNAPNDESFPKTEDVGADEAQKSRQIGPYKLLQRIGVGGMGEVWMAEQKEPIRRRVALKMIKAGHDSKAVMARFEAERQALALMDHPNIATVLDAGTTDAGLPYFVMELVQGIPITDYCDRERLTPKKRLELFGSVCEAVQHAHQKGIIHRDLKPANILVQMKDGKAVPKVIDFGLAKALQHQAMLTDKTLFTEFGRIIGTVQYMSPEQATLDAVNVDTRSDIYSLGVILYELLTGSTPIDKKLIQNNALLKSLEWVREKEPVKPSQKLSTNSNLLKTTSEQRSIQPFKLESMLRGELDWIVLKAIEKERSRRYGTASAFAEDIRRFICGDAISARAPTTVYLVKKIVAKNKATFFMIAVSLLLLIGGLISTSLFWRQAELLANENQVLAEKSGIEAKRAQFALKELKESQFEARIESERSRYFTEHFEAIDFLAKAQGGHLKMNRADWPLIGNPFGEKVLIVLFDYESVQSRRTLKNIAPYLEKNRECAFISVPLNVKNGQVVMHNEDSLSKFAVITWLAAPQELGTFHNWVLEQKEIPSTGAARKKVQELIGPKIGVSRFSLLAERYLQKFKLLYERLGSGQLPKICGPATTIVGEFKGSNPFELILQEVNGGQSKLGASKDNQVGKARSDVRNQTNSEKYWVVLTQSLQTIFFRKPEKAK